MFELRWNEGVLEQRTRGFQQDASMALCGFTEWSDWEPVPHAYNADLVENLAMLVRRLCRVSGAKELSEQAMEYLSKNGLSGDITRKTTEQGQP